MNPSSEGGVRGRRRSIDAARVKRRLDETRQSLTVNPKLLIGRWAIALAEDRIAQGSSSDSQPLNFLKFAMSLRPSAMSLRLSAKGGDRLSGAGSLGF
jgi:hypothetical protein